jgi:spermidine synthase
LQNNTPAYERWAQQQRVWAEQKIAGRSADEAEVLNFAAKASLESVHRRFDKVEEMDSRMSKVESAQAQMLTMMARTERNMSCHGGGGGGVAAAAAAGPVAARYADGK